MIKQKKSEIHRKSKRFSGCSEIQRFPTFNLNQKNTRGVYFG